MPAEMKPRIRLEAGLRRQEILDVARRLISERGFRGVTLDQIAESCNMTKPGLLHHFASKTELLIAVLARQDEVDFGDGIQQAPLWAGPDACRKQLDLLIERDLARPEIVRLYTVLASEALSVDHPAHDAFKQRLEWSRGWLEDAVRPWHPDPASFALQYLSFIDGLQLNWLRDPSIDIRREWQTFANKLFA
jgi:AcrR family transcriptional regulator